MNPPFFENMLPMVQTIISMGNSLGMEVIVEGVETEAQRNFLEHNGCHAYQGYFFGRPLPLSEFEAFCEAGLTRLG